MKIQEYLTCAIQNIQTLIKHGSKLKKAMALRVKLVPEAIMKAVAAIISPKKRLFLDTKSNFAVFSKNIILADYKFYSEQPLSH